MTLTKNDIILLLTELGEQGEEVDGMIADVLKYPDLPVAVLQFINEKHLLKLSAFYEKMRRSYNNNRSKLYGSLFKEEPKPEELLATLASYQLQAILFANTLEEDEKEMFLRHSRLETVSVVFANYFKNSDITNCYKLLQLIRADLIACDVIMGRRSEI